MSAITWASAMFFVASLGMTHAIGRRKLFNPLVAFSGIWFLNLLIYELDKVYHVFRLGLSDYAAFLMGLSFLVFLVSAIVGMTPMRTNAKERALSIDDYQLRPLARFAKLAGALLLLGVMWKLAIIVSAVGSPLEYLTQIRQMTVGGEVAFPLPARFLVVCGYLAVLNLGILAAFRWNLKLALVIGVVILLFFANDMTTGSRGSVFNTVLLLAITVLLTVQVKSGRVRLSHLLNALGVMLGGLALITVILYLRSDREISYFDRFVFDNYVYFIGSIPAYSYFVAHPWPSLLPGQWTFAGLYQLLDGIARNVAGAHILTSETFFTSYAPITSIGPFNTTGYLTYFHSDLGESGVVIFTALMGFLSGYTFLRAVFLKRVLDIQLAALMMFLVIYSVRGIATNGMMFWVSLALVSAQHWMMQRGGRIKVLAQPAQVQAFGDVK